MQIYNFISGSIMERANLKYEDVCYAVRLSGIVNRRNQMQGTSRFGGFVNNLGNVISDTFSSAVNNIFLLRLNNGVISVISEKMAPLHINAAEVYRSLSFAPGVINGTAKFLQGDLESASFRVGADRFHEQFCGNFKQFIMDFDTAPIYPYTNMLEKFVSVVYSKHKEGEAEYKFTAYKKIGTLISFDARSIYLHNDKRKIDFETAQVYSNKNGYSSFLIKDCNNVYELIEIFENNPQDVADMEMNLVREVSDISECALSISVPESLLCAENFLSQFGVGEFSVIAVDEKIYCFEENTLKECGVFKVGDDLFLSTHSKTKKYPEGNKIAEILYLLPMGFDSFFMEKDIAKPFLLGEEILKFTVGEEEIRSEEKNYRYDKMENYRYEADDFSCRISFSYEGENVELCSANSIGVYISNKQEKVFVSSNIRTYSVNQLYQCYYERFMKNFLAVTFAEIFKTQRLMNNETEVETLLSTVNADENAALRGALKSVVAKFKNVDDLQAELIQKVALLEIQRKKIQKMYEEWALYYPHYMANLQLNWLKGAFGSAVSEKMLSEEYWKCVSHFKSALSGSNAFVQRSMNEIGQCTARISAALPEEVKRCDVTKNLRISSTNHETMLKTGTNLLMGATAGLEITNIFLRGFSATSPLTLSMSAKMLVDSYAKDVEMRKNIKAFGTQALEWWIIFMKGIRIHIMEITNSVNTYNKACLRRDTGIFKKLPEEKRNMVMTKLALGLKEKIIGGIDDKFMEIMPQLNMRISNIIEELDNNSEICNATLGEFKNNLFI